MPSLTSLRTTAWPWLYQGSIGPPVTKTAGRFTRAAAMSMPGTILSQVPRSTMASKRCASIISSTEAAMTSRRGRE